VFYFGNNPGENTRDFLVNYDDVFDVVWPKLFTTAPVEGAADTNGDRLVNYDDLFSTNCVWPCLFASPALAAITSPATPAPPPDSDLSGATAQSADSSAAKWEPTALEQSAARPAETWESASWIVRSLAWIHPPSESLLTTAAELHPAIVPVDPPPDDLWDVVVDDEAAYLWDDPPDIDLSRDPWEFSNSEALMAEALWVYEFDYELADSEADDPHGESASDEFFTLYFAE